MKKHGRISAALLALLMLLSSCTGDPAETTAYPDVTAGQTDTVGTDSTAVTTDAPDNKEPQPTEVPDGTVLYYENFDSDEAVEETSKALFKTGFSAITTSKGAISNATADVKIREYNGGLALYLENNKSKQNDSYYQVLSEKQMGYFHENNYTVQYDLEYTDAANASRYITLLTGYSGGYYMSFHFRNGGYAHNQIRRRSDWFSFDLDDENACYAMGENSIASKLIGKPADGKEQLFKGVPVSVRYVVDWENGNKVYMRVNSPDSASKGEWVQVSQYSAESAGGKYWDPDSTGGAGITLKVGGAQNGYIDNITVWTGTGDEPQDKSSPILRAGKNACYNHYFTDPTCIEISKCKYCGVAGADALGHVVGEDKKCSRCGMTEDNIKNGWLLDKLPAYIGGKKATGLYRGGQELDAGYSPEKDSQTVIVSETNKDEYNTYLKTLESNGFSKTFENKIDENLYAQYQNGEQLVYAYFVENLKEARIVLDNTSDITVDKFGYTSDQKSGAEIYQIGLPYKTSQADQRINCGMMYVIKTADNAVIVIDGGGYQQFNSEQIDNVMNILYDITDTPNGGTVRVAAWYITHQHGDHIEGFSSIAKRYKDNLKFERIFYNSPSIHEDTQVLFEREKTVNNLKDRIINYVEDDSPVFMQIHTGQTFELGGVRAEVLYTHEDLTSTEDGRSMVSNDYNNSCAVVRFHFDGKSFLVLGDINAQVANLLIKSYSEKTMYSDVLQAAHHLLNPIDNLYKYIKAPAVFIPQGEFQISAVPAFTATRNVLKSYVKNDMLYLAYGDTVGLGVVNGELEKVKTYPLLDCKFDGSWGWF